jgi:uncharacterized protein
MSHVFTDDGLCTATWRSRPGDFVSLMTLYESNYIRLRALAGDVFTAPDVQVSVCAVDSPLHLRVVERSPYTVTLIMTYEFSDAGGKTMEPDLQLRVYRDARLAEALRFGHWRDRATFSERRRRLGRNLDARWQRNIMLNKWLEYCFDCGHRFAARTADT